jgi:phosphotransferase system enzyme I (PtsI)
LLFIKGKIASKGIAIGKLKEFTKNGNAIKCNHIEDTNNEWERFVKAKETAMNELEMLYERAVKEVGEENAAIFEVHQMMLEDDDYMDSVKNIIVARQVNAEFAVATTGDHFALIFSEMEDDYMKERAADVRDISERLIHALSDQQTIELEEPGNGEPVIIIADDLVPSETIQLDRKKVLAFITRLGSANSHTAILARTMNIPALVCSQAGKDVDGKMAIVDGDAGEIIIEPDGDDHRTAPILNFSDLLLKYIVLNHSSRY